MAQFCCVRPYLGIEIVFYHLLLQTERIYIDLKFQFYACKNHQNNYYYGCCLSEEIEICLIFFS